MVFQLDILFFRTNVNDEIKTPKGMTLTLQVADQANEQSYLAASGDNERLVVIQASETNLMDQNFSKAMRLTLVSFISNAELILVQIPKRKRIL